MSIYGLYGSAVRVTFSVLLRPTWIRAVNENKSIHPLCVGVDALNVYNSVTVGLPLNAIGIII